MGRKRTGGGNEDRRITFDDSLLREQHAAGMTIVEIATAHGCSPHPVKKALNRLGLRREPKPRPGALSGSRNPAWSGGRRQRSDGYIEIWTPTGVRLEHQIIMEQQLGRPLVAGEVVHHIDENKTNNDPSNLRLTTQAEHIKEHLADMHAARYRR